MIGPELGFTQPGMTIVCGDSHTATHGAFGALAFGIGTSEVEHVLATQTLLQHKPKTLEIRVDGRLPPGVTAKDLILYLIGRISTSGGAGYCIEYTGEAIRGLSMEERMTVCNMTIEAGARAGLIAPDENDLRLSPRPAVRAAGFRRRRARAGGSCPRDPGASYDRVETFDAADVQPQVTWGTNPGQVTDVGGKVPDPAEFADPDRAEGRGRGAGVHGPEARHADHVDPDRPRVHRLLHQRADRGPAGRGGRGPRPPRGRRRPRAWSCPAADWSSARPRPRGSTRSSARPGFEWREAGCSMCLAMNPDKLEPGERCAATSNRNFEGRQGKGGRTHLVSPAMAAAAAVAGHFVDVRQWEYK